MKFRTTGRYRRLGDDPWLRFRTAMVRLALIAGLGTVGYILLGLDPLDALYQTVITVSTVGFGEIGNTGDIDDGYRIFTIVLIVLGTGSALYTLGVLFETLFEGQLNGRLRRRRMQREIDRLSDHVIICGYGQVGRSIADEIRRSSTSLVVVDRSSTISERLVDDATLHVVGEATDDEVLELAGIDRAQTLVLALDSDADNLYVTLTARTVRPDLFIVARANGPSVSPKLRRAGADRVVNPHEIGGSRMAALVLQPEVAEFLDVVMHDDELEVRLTEVRLEADSPFVDRSLADCALAERTGTTVLALRRNGRFVTNPRPDATLQSGDVVIALGTPEQVDALHSLGR